MTQKLPPSASVTRPLTGAKLHAPAAQRNTQALGDLMRDHAPSSGHALELASGTGQHIIHFAQRFPDVIWQPTEVDAARIDSISAYAQEADLPNLRPAHHLDVTANGWAGAVGAHHVVVLVNLLHLITTTKAQTAINGAIQALAPKGRFILYGPFKRSGVLTSEGDTLFDAQLRSTDPDIGYKNDDDVAQWLTNAGAATVTRVEMPANNLAFLAGV